MVLPSLSRQVRAGLGAVAQEEIALINRALPGQLSFKLSELLENANPLEYLYLDFATSRRVI